MGLTLKGKNLLPKKFAPSFLKNLTLVEMEWQSCFPGNILSHLNFLTTKKVDDNFSSANFQKLLSLSYIILRIQRLEGKQCRSRLGGS